jgi:hypothetical protein
VKEYRPELPKIPEYIARLPVFRGYPVPWFVETIPGKDPDFRIVSRTKLAAAIAQRRCWVCGVNIPTAQEFAFVIGPMCAINRTSSEPPSHVECANFSALACPFLARPKMVRREDDLPAELSLPPGMMIGRNPGVALVWITTTYTKRFAPNGVLIKVGEPSRVWAFAEGRNATADEVRASIESGMPLLREAAQREGLLALSELAAARRRAYKVLGLAA